MNKERSLFFGYHPTVNELFFTSDDCAFFKENDANAHAGSLQKQGKDGSVTKLIRAEYDAFVASEAQEAGTGGSDETIDHEVTQEDLDNNPELVAAGVAVGDTIQIPKDATQTTPEEIKADVKAVVEKAKATGTKVAKKAAKKK